MVPLNASKFDGGRPERVLDIVTKNETLVYWYDQENKKQSLVRLLPGESPPMKCLRSRSTSKHIIAVSAEFGDMTSNPAPGEEDRQLRGVHQHLLAQGLRSLDGTSSKQRYPRSAAQPRQRKCPHRRRHSGLPGSKPRSAGLPDPVFPGLSPL